MIKLAASINQVLKEFDYKKKLELKRDLKD